MIDLEQAVAPESSLYRNASRYLGWMLSIDFDAARLRGALSGFVRSPSLTLCWPRPPSLEA